MNANKKTPGRNRAQHEAVVAIRSSNKAVAIPSRKERRNMDRGAQRRNACADWS